MFTNEKTSACMYYILHCIFVSTELMEFSSFNLLLFALKTFNILLVHIFLLSYFVTFLLEQDFHKLRALLRRAAQRPQEKKECQLKLQYFCLSNFQYCAFHLLNTYTYIFLKLPQYFNILKKINIYFRFKQKFCFLSFNTCKTLF